MVCNKIGTQRNQDGIDMCEATLNQYGNKIYMHSHFKDDEFGKKHDPDAAEQIQIDSNGVNTPMKYDHCLNYNYGQGLHLIDQHGITLMFGDTVLGYALAIAKTHNLLGPPGNMYFLVITKDFSPHDSAWAVISGTLDANGHITVGPGKAKIVTDEYGVTVAHEMLHCFHVYHHGDIHDYGNCAFEYDAVKKQWIQTQIFGKQRVDGANIYAPRVVHLYWENNYNTEIGLADVEKIQKRYWHIFGDNSTHSGVEDCIMRYDNANGFTRPGFDKVYLLKSNFKENELTGINICNSGTGTGVNNKEHKPISRYGNAAPGRGDCIHQFCVSDRYN